MSEQINEIAAKLKGAKNENEVISIFQEYGKEITPEQAQQALDLLNKEEQDLSLDDLDNIAGGTSEEFWRKLTTPCS